MNTTKNKDLIFNVLNITLLVLFSLLCFYPLYYIFIYSLSDSAAAVSRGVYLLPQKFTIQNYIQIFQSGNIPMAAGVSGLRALLGTVLTLICSFIYGYLVTQKELIGRRFFYRFLIVSMYLSAGLIPWYLLMRMLHLQNTFALYIVPGAVGAFYVILIKTYIEQLPASLEESAQIDGAGPLTIMFKIIMPLCRPVLATIAVFSAVGQWNSWQDNFFLATDPNLKTLQLLLLEYLQSNTSQFSLQGASAHGLANATKAVLTTSTIQATISVLAILPIAVVYPAMQKHFVKGMVLGAVKG